MPSSHLILCRPLLFLPPIPPSIRVFSNESALRMRWPKYWSFSFSISPSNEHPRLISFRMVSAYISVNQLQVYIYAVCLEPFSCLPSPTHLGHHRAPVWAPWVHSSFPPAPCFTHGSVYMSVLLRQFIPPAPFLAMSTSSFWFCFLAVCFLIEI